MNLTEENLREMKCELFATRDTDKEAMEYAASLMRTGNMEEIEIFTALWVVRNTMIELIIKALKED